MNTKFLPLNIMDTTNSSLYPSTTNREVRYTKFAQERGTNQSLRNRLSNMLPRTTSGKILLGLAIFTGVGIVIAIPTILLSTRTITPAITSNKIHHFQPLFASQLTIQPTSTLTTQSTTQPTTEQSRNLPDLSDFIATTAKNLTSQVNIENMQNNLQKLLAIGVRDNEYNSSNNRYKQAIKIMNCILREIKATSFRQNFSYGNDGKDYRNTRDFSSAIPTNSKTRNCKPRDNSSCNLCTLIPGKTNNIIVAGAHLDTVAGSPGANDNASSVVALLEAIRIFKESNLMLNNPILFCFWGSEEKQKNNREEARAFGSGFFLYNDAYKQVFNNLTTNLPAQNLTNEIRIQSCLNLELVGTKNRMYEDIEIDDPKKQHEGERASPNGTQKLTELYAEFLTDKGVNFFRASPHTQRTSVRSFYDNNIPALTITAGIDDYPYCYHQPCDTATKIDFEVLANITQTVVYALTKLSLES